MISIRSETCKPGRTYYILLAGYLAFVLYGSLVPLQFHYLPPSTAWELFRSKIQTTLAITSRSNFVANILLFIPLVFLAMGALTRENSRRFQGIIAALIWTGAVAFGSWIEFLQLYVPARATAFNDIIAQMIGNAAGLILWFLFGTPVTDWARSVWREHAGEKAAVKILIGYLVAFVIYQLFPFNLTISIHDIYHTLKYRANLVPFTNRNSLTVYRIFINTITYVPIGFLLALLVRHKQFSFIKTVFWGFFTTATIEFLQFFVEDHTPSATDVVLGTAGAIIGIIFADFFGPVARYPLVRSPTWKALARPVEFLILGLYVVLVGWSRWLPFDFRWPEDGLIVALYKNLHIPFYYQYRTRESLAAVQVVREFLLFFFLGLIIAAGLRENRRRSILTVIVLAGILEGGQLFVPSRFFDLTTLAVNIVGGISGIFFFPVFLKAFILPQPEERLRTCRTEEKAN